VSNPFESLTLDSLRRRSSLKWREHPEDVLPMWVAEMDVPTAEPVVAAVRAALEGGDTGYPAGRSYAEAMAEFAADRWGWRLEVEHTALVPDVMIGITEVLQLVTGPGDGVIVTPPVYPPFFAFIAHAGRRVVEAPLGEDHRLDPDAISAAMVAATAGGRAAALLLCNPHNPTGTVHTVAELAAVAELSRRHDVTVVVDEIHAPLVHRDATHVPYLSVPGSDNAYAVMSASKGWNLAGLKAAVAVAGAEAAATLETMPEIVWHGASHVAVIAHAAALREGVPWLDDTIAALELNRDLVADLLAAQLPAVRYQVPRATYLAWLDCTALDLGDDPSETFLQRGRVAMIAGPDFGTGGAGHVRLNFAASAAVITEGVRRMARALDEPAAGG